MARDCQQLSGGRASPPLRRPAAAGASFRRIPAPRSGAAEGLLPTGATPRAARALVPRPRGGTTTTSSHARATQVFEVFSSFTTLASFLAFAVELQYGGRIPFFAGRTELCSLVFLGLTGAVVSLPKRTMIKKVPQLPLRPCVVHRRTLQSGSRRPCAVRTGRQSARPLGHPVPAHHGPRQRAALSELRRDPRVLGARCQAAARQLRRFTRRMVQSKW